MSRYREDEGIKFAECIGQLFLALSEPSSPTVDSLHLCVLSAVTARVQIYSATRTLRTLLCCVIEMRVYWNMDVPT